jgi:NAD(P)-dependent dehydrogenase (short-subunit alcohol dehydrogenase family)
MTVTLITGANKGLGYETARRLIELGHTVYIGARSVERGEAAAAELGGQFVRLDVTDDASVATAMSVIDGREGRLDVLVNNAGISVGADVNGPDALKVFDTNAIGVIRVTQAAVSMLTVQYAKTYPDIKFNAVEPGFTATDLTPGSGAGQPVEKGAEVIVRMATIGKNGPTGTFQENESELAW